MNPTPEQITLIATRIAGNSTPAPELVTELNAATQPNPTPIAMLSRFLKKDDLIAQLSVESSTKVLTFPNLELVFQSFDMQDHVSCVAWVYTLCVMMEPHLITYSEMQTLVELIQTPVPDPNYVPLLSWSHIHLGREITEQDINATRFAPKQAALNQLISEMVQAQTDIGNGVDVDLSAWGIS
jgi:hypothetical protein